MATFNKSEVKHLDRLLEYLYKKQNKYSIMDSSENIQLDEISVTRIELIDNLKFSDFEINKYIQILRNKDVDDKGKFISIDPDSRRIWLMDYGIEFFYIGGFRRERNEQLKKRNYELASIIFGVVATIGVLFSIYMNFIDTNRLDKRIDKIEAEYKLLK
jgi:hypothetical protein